MKDSCRKEPHILPAEEGGILGRIVGHGAARALVIGGAIGGTIAAVVALCGLYAYATAALSRFDYSTITAISRSAAAIEEAFHELTALDLPRCSPQHLAAMRAIVFRTAVRDAAYRLDDKNLCSSGLGMVASPQLEFGDPDFVGEDGTEVWLRRVTPAAPGLVSTVVARGGYSLLTAPAQHPTGTSMGAALSTVLVNRKTGTTLTFRGPAVPYPTTKLTDDARFHDGFQLISVGCVVAGLLCYVQTVTPHDLLQSQAVPYLLLVMLGICIGALTGLVRSIMRQRHGTLPYRLRTAIAEGEISLAYLPTIDLVTRRIVGAEALMRWILPNGDSIAPSEFIPAAEASPLITDLDCLAIEIAAREIGDLLRTRSDLVVSINIVARDLTEESFFAAIERHIVGAGIPAGSIAFELTERQAITSDAVVAGAQRLRTAGHHLYLDDFGTGYSNLGYLDRLHVDAIKLDKLFTQSVGADPIRARLTATILEMGLDLNLPIIVEGVELPAQEDYFRNAGIRLAQGWLYSRPLTAAAFVALVAEMDRNPRLTAHTTGDAASDTTAPH